MLYQDLLRRHADSGGDAFWADYFAQATMQGDSAFTRVIAGLLGSAEYARLLPAPGTLLPLLPADPLLASP